MRLDRGILFMSDTRTNAGVDHISTFRKMTTWEAPGKAAFVLMTAGNLATSLAVVSLLEAVDEGARRALAIDPRARL